MIAFLQFTKIVAIALAINILAVATLATRRYNAEPYCDFLCAVKRASKFELTLQCGVQSRVIFERPSPLTPWSSRSVCVL